MKLIEELLASPEPAIRWKVRTQVLGEQPGPRAASPIVEQLLAPLQGGTLPDAYAKWQGAHWALAALADIGYPPGDERLHRLRDQVLDTWLNPRSPVLLIDGRFRMHASQHGNALWFLTVLGLDDGRCAGLAERLLHWQWPDGGWNCSRHPGATTSSFSETLLPMRGLHAYGKSVTKRAARQAAEVFLSRRLAFRRRDGALMRADFTKLHYPLYWHYDILGGLKGMRELGLLGDPRCADALDLLETMRLEDGWPAHAAYRATRSADWGGTGRRRANPWVTADALAVLRAAGRV